MLIDDLQPYLERLINRELTSRAVAQALNVSEAHLCRVLKANKITKAPIYKPDPGLLQARKAHRIKVANSMPPEEAAKAANCSVRTIYRYKR